MILAIIGRCVIVMNKHYWNEFSSQFIDKDTEKKILKIYQYSLPMSNIYIPGFNESMGSDTAITGKHNI